MFLHLQYVCFFSFLLVVESQYEIPDHAPLVIVLYAQRNITIYVSTSNPSREPKQWKFWYDPLIVFDASKDIFQYNEQVRFTFSISSIEFEQIARKTIITNMNPDVEQFSMFWIIEPLPIDTLTIYIVNQLLDLVPAIEPCSKTKLYGLSKFECQFQTSSIMITSSMLEKILCGKYHLQFYYYIKPKYVPSRLATRYNLMNLRSKFLTNKYIHKRQEEQFLKEYFLEIQSIDNTTKESDLQRLFSLAINTTTRYEISNLNQIWSLDNLETIINRDLFYLNTKHKNKVLFHLRNTNSPWILKSTDRQIFSIDEIQEMFFDQDLINVEWLAKETCWKIRSIIVHQLSNILDTLQLILIDQQYKNDKLNATNDRHLDCSTWSTECSCQSIDPGIVFTSNTQGIRISNVDANLTKTGFTLEFWIRPDVLPTRNSPVQIINFRREFLIQYQPKGELTFSVNDTKQTHLYTTTLRAIPLKKWSFISGIYSATDKQMSLYVNGDLTSSVLLSTAPKQGTNDIIVGYDFLGAIRDVHLWACVRTAEEIRFLTKKKKLIGNETCLIGFWPMNEGDGQFVLDFSTNGPPIPGTMGFDNNPNLITDPIWLNVVPEPPTTPPPTMLTWQIFRANITLPLVVRWGTYVDIPLPTDYDGDGFADFAVYRLTILSWIISPSNNPLTLIYKTMGLPGDIPIRANFDGDRYYDFVLFRPSTSQWIAQLSSNPGFTYTHVWGKFGDVPCPGDFDGDGRTDFVVYRKGMYYINPSSDPTVQWTKQWGQPGDKCVPNCDFDGDGVTDFVVWTPTTAIWSWIQSTAPWLIYQRQWGYQYDLPTCGDFDGDRRHEFTVFRNYTGDWFVMSNIASSVIITYRWGRPDDIPIAGDYDGNGKSEFGHWRPRKGRTYIWEIVTSVLPVALVRVPWGIAGDQVVIGDFDGDKKSDFTVWRPTNGFWYTLLAGRPSIQIIKHWGFTPNDTALAADWDGDGFTDYTIYRPTTGHWYIMLARNPILQIFMQWGVPKYKDIGVPGDFDGDGKYDFAVWRPSNGMWYILPSSNPLTVVMAQWGIEGDIPVTGVDFDGDGKTDCAVWRPSTGSWYILPSSNPLYPFFGPFILRQPTIPLPPIVAVPPPPPPPSVVFPSEALFPRGKPPPLPGTPGASPLSVAGPGLPAGGPGGAPITSVP